MDRLLKAMKIVMGGVRYVAFTWLAMAGFVGLLVLIIGFFSGLSEGTQEVLASLWIAACGVFAVVMMVSMIWAIFRGRW